MDITLRSNKSTIDIELSRNNSYIIRCQENLIYDQKLFFLTDKLKLRNTCLVRRLSRDMLTFGFSEVWSNFYLFFSSCNSGHVALSKIISSEEHIGPVFYFLCLLTWKRVPSNWHLYGTPLRYYLSKKVYYGTTQSSSLNIHTHQVVHSSSLHESNFPNLNYENLNLTKKSYLDASDSLMS